MDSTIKPVRWESKPGAAFSYNKIRSHYPLLVPPAETNEPLRLMRRPGKAAFAGGVEEALDLVLVQVREKSRRIVR